MLIFSNGQFPNNVFLPKFFRLSDNKSMLLECSVVSAKLRAGHVLQFGTNNAIEANNGKLKMRVGKPRNISELVQSLIDYCEGNKTITNVEN